MKNRERGAVILESTYCIFVALIVVFFMVSFGFFLYQRAMVSIVANEVAEEVVHTYKLRDVTDRSSVTIDDVTGVGKYRYSLFKNGFKSKNKVKVKNAMEVRLSKTSLAKKKGGITVDINTVVDDIGRRHYEVSVKQEYAFLLGDLLKFVGQEGKQELEATSYVESVDILHYVNTVKTTQYGWEKLSDSVPVLGIIDSVISFMHSIVNIP